MSPKPFKILGNKRVSSETVKLYGDININKDFEGCLVEKKAILRKFSSKNVFYM